MTTPFAHAHVAHVSKIGRRRSRSLTLQNFDQDDAPGHTVHRKRFLAQLQKERQKQHEKHNEQHREQQENRNESQEDHHQAIVTRVEGTKNTLSTPGTSLGLLKRISSTTSKTSDSEEDEEHQPAVTRVVRVSSLMLTKKKTSFPDEAPTGLAKDVTSISSSIVPSAGNEYHPHTTQIPPLESTMSFRKPISTKPSNYSNANIFITSKNSNLDSSIISNPLLSSTAYLMSKSTVFDQDFHLGDNEDHAGRNDSKRHGKINISGREKSHNTYDRKLSAKSSASFMAAIIAIIIGIIAFAFGLTSLVLVLLLRSTVANQLAVSGTSSTTSNSLVSTDYNTWLTGCTNYTTLNEPNRHIFAPGSPLACDSSPPFLNRTNPVWIRFTGTGGTTLPLYTPGMNVCGSEGTGWYDGAMPSSTGEVANGTVCFTWYNTVCRFSQSISVAHCGSYYTYRLPPAPTCMMRYCTI